MAHEKKSSKGSRFGVVGVLVNYGLARFTPKAPVRRLVDALGSRDEDTSTAAYIALTKLGSDIAPQIAEYAKQGKETKALVQLLGDLANQSVIDDLKQFVNGEDESVAATARESLEALSERFSNHD